MYIFLIDNELSVRNAGTKRPKNVLIAHKIHRIKFPMIASGEIET